MGPCAKAFVPATLITPEGRRFYATNEVRNPQRVCPRIENNVRDDYELCHIVCQQTGHAEANVLRQAGPWAIGSVIYIEHHRCCKNCQALIKRAGATYVLGPPPD
jgi:hypothetical protein